MFGGKYYEYKAAVELFDLLGLEDECKEPGFVRWLMDRKKFRVGILKWWSRTTIDYKFEYKGYGEEPFRSFYTIGKAIDGQDHITAITELRKYYDQYRREKLNKTLKKAGIATAVAVSLASIITGLSLGLKRKGHDLVRDSKLHPSGTPWSELENASGKGLIVVGNNIYLIIGGVCVYLYRKK